MATIMSWAEPSPHILPFLKHGFKSWSLQIYQLLTSWQMTLTLKESGCLSQFLVATWATRTQILGAQHQFLGAMGYWATVSVNPCT